MLWYIQESQWGELVYWWYPHKINRASCIQNTQRTDIILCDQDMNKKNSAFCKLMLWYIQESQWGELVYWWYPHKINRASCIQNTQRTDIILCDQDMNKRWSIDPDNIIYFKTTE